MIKTEIVNNILICFPKGRIGNDYAADFKYNMTQIINDHVNCDLILNMQDVSSISSHGIAVLIPIAQEIKDQNCLFSICNPKDLVMKIISIFNVSSIIDVYQTEEEAIDAMSQLTVV